MHTINIQRKSKNTINSYPANASTFFLILAFRSVYKELHADHETGAADNK